MSCAVNGSAFLKNGDTNEKGSATELAILKLFKKMGFNYLEYREKYAPIKKFPFNSERKRMSTIISMDGKTYILLKGASEIIL